MESEIHQHAYFDNVTLVYDMQGYNTTNFSSYEMYAVPQILFLSVMCLFIVVGNSCLLAAIRLSKMGRKSRMNFFIMHLSLADLFVGVTVSMCDLASKLTVEWYAGNVMCKIVMYAQTVVTYSSTYLLVSLSLDRYDAVARPMNFSRSGFRGRILVFVAWLVSLVFALPTLFIYEEKVIEGLKQCWLEFPDIWHWQLYITSIALVTFLVPAVIIASCYIAIIYVIWSKSQGYKSPSDSEDVVLKKGGSASTTPTRLTISSSRQTTGRGIIPKAKIRTIKMTLVIVIVFILCWSPYFVYNVLYVFYVLPHNVPLSTLIHSAAPLNSAANPIIYGIFSTRICQNLRRIPTPAFLRRLICHCKDSRASRRTSFATNRKYMGSHGTDHTLSTLDATKRANLFVNNHNQHNHNNHHTTATELRSSPLLNSSTHYHSPMTSHVTRGGDVVTKCVRKSAEDKRSFFQLFRSKGASRNKEVEYDLQYELTPLARSDIVKETNVASSCSEDSSDSNGRLSKRTVETKSSFDSYDQATASKKSSLKFEPGAISSSGNSLYFLEVTRHGNQNESEGVSPDEETTMAFSEFSEATANKERETTSCYGDQKAYLTLSSSENEEDMSMKETKTDGEDKTDGDLVQHTSTHHTNSTDAIIHNNPDLDTVDCDSSTSCVQPMALETIGRASNGQLEDQPMKTRNGTSEARLANRRPSGVPSVRRKLTSQDNLLLRRAAEIWAMSEGTSTESSVVQ